MDPWVLGGLVALGWAVGGIAWDTLMVWWLGPRRAKALIITALKGPEGEEVRKAIIQPAIILLETKLNQVELNLEALRTTMKGYDPSEMRRAVNDAISGEVGSRVETILARSVKGLSGRIAEELKEAITADDRLLQSAVDEDLRRGGLDSKASEWAAKLDESGYRTTAGVVRRSPRIGMLLLKRMGVEDDEVKEWADALR